MTDPFQRGLNEAAAGARHPRAPDLDTCTDAEVEDYDQRVTAHDYCEGVDDEGEPRGE